tara:strand:- start:336 stop:491 length:156 start_codon:yes stop_codon:yes gene_type:complete
MYPYPQRYIIKFYQYPSMRQAGPRQNIDTIPMHFGDKFPIKHALQNGILLL